MDSAYLLAVFGAAAFRFLVGVDVGAEYDTTALSADLCPDTCPGGADCNAYCDDASLQGEPIPRVPWAIRVRPDLLFAVFDSRHYFYVSADGSYVQPLLDTYEGGGNLLTAARLRLGRGVVLNPGLFVRAASSNELIRDQGIAGTAIPTTELFYSVSGGGWLGLELPMARRARLSMRAEAEAWALDWIPDELRTLTPALNVVGNVTAMVSLTRSDGLAFDVQAVESLYLPDVDGDAEHQVSITGRVIWRRYWLPHLMTDLAVGGVGLMERDGEWAPNVTGSAILVMAGRPRWFTLNISYERRFEYLSLVSPGSMQDAAEVYFGFGPFSGFDMAFALSWTRQDLEVRSRNDGLITDRPFHTFGLRLEARYMFEAGGFGVGPFFEGHVFTPFAEQSPFDMDYEFLPPGYDYVEMVLLVGLRLQWGMESARSRTTAAHGGALGTARARGDRRLAVRRMSRQERADPARARGLGRGDGGDDPDMLFREHDPFGRVQGEYEEEPEDSGAEGLDSAPEGEQPDEPAGGAADSLGDDVLAAPPEEPAPEAPVAPTPEEPAPEAPVAPTPEEPTPEEQPPVSDPAP